MRNVQLTLFNSQSVSWTELANWNSQFTDFSSQLQLSTHTNNSNSQLAEYLTQLGARPHDKFPKWVVLFIHMVFQRFSDIFEFCKNIFLCEIFAIVVCLHVTDFDLICYDKNYTHQNSYSMSYLLGTVTKQWLDRESVITTVNCQQHSDCRHLSTVTNTVAAKAGDWLNSSLLV